MARICLTGGVFFGRSFPAEETQVTKKIRNNYMYI